jgi:predicted dehydrogenase
VNRQALNIGLVGCGYWGPNLIRNFKSLPGCNVRMMCDTSAARLRHMKGLYPDVEGVTDFDHMLNGANLDAIVVATPIRQHYKLANDSLGAGKHTFIEKPMAASSEECHALVKTAEREQVSLMIGHTFLYSPAVRKIKEIIDAGDIGRIRYISSRRLSLGLFHKDINVVWDLAPHDISIILYLMGEMPSAVNCQGRANITPGVEDVASTILSFPGGGFATIQNSWLDPKKVRDMTIVGERRMIVYDDMEPVQKIKIYDERVDPPPHYDTFSECHYAYHYGDMYAPHIDTQEPLRVECQHFLDCIRSRAQPLSCGVRGTELVKILEAASRSLKLRGELVPISLTQTIASNAGGVS